jgi:hypothetical protein
VAPANQGKCVSCGFLAAWGWGGSGNTEPQAVGRYGRDTGDIHVILGCFRQAADLFQETRDASMVVTEEGDAPSLPKDRILAVLQRDRQCPEWFAFQAGLSPKDHLDRMNAIELEQQRQALQVRLAEMERVSRASSEKIEADSLEIAKALKSFTTRWTYVAAALAFAVLVVTLLIWLGVRA